MSQQNNNDEIPPKGKLVRIPNSCSYIVKIDGTWQYLRNEGPPIIGVVTRDVNIMRNDYLEIYFAGNLVYATAQDVHYEGEDYKEI